MGVLLHQGRMIVICASISDSLMWFFHDRWPNPVLQLDCWIIYNCSVDYWLFKICTYHGAVASLSLLCVLVNYHHLLYSINWTLCIRIFFFQHCPSNYGPKLLNEFGFYTDVLKYVFFMKAQAPCSEFVDSSFTRFDLCMVQWLPSDRWDHLPLKRVLYLYFNNFRILK